MNFMNRVQFVKILPLKSWECSIHGNFPPQKQPTIRYFFELYFHKISGLMPIEFDSLQYRLVAMAMKCLSSM